MINTFKSNKSIYNSRRSEIDYESNSYYLNEYNNNYYSDYNSDLSVSKSNNNFIVLSDKKEIHDLNEFEKRQSTKRKQEGGNIGGKKKKLATSEFVGLYKEIYTDELLNQDFDDSTDCIAEEEMEENFIKIRGRPLKENPNPMNIDFNTYTNNYDDYPTYSLDNVPKEDIKNYIEHRQDKVECLICEKSVLLWECFKYNNNFICCDCAKNRCNERIDFKKELFKWNIQELEKNMLPRDWRLNRWNKCNRCKRYCPWWCFIVHKDEAHSKARKKVVLKINKSCIYCRLWKKLP